MMDEVKISGLSALGEFLKNFLEKKGEGLTQDETQLQNLMLRSEIENPWFTRKNLEFCLEHWSTLLQREKIEHWLKAYPPVKTPKKIGLVLPGNLPLVGLHDVLCVILSNHIPIIKTSSKDRLLLPFLLDLWKKFSGGGISFHLAERLSNFDAVIATGSDNTSRYFQYYFRDFPSIIRKNRTSVAVLQGNESQEDLQLLSEDIFRYFGLGCRNVTRLFLPKDFGLEQLFENFSRFKDVIHHNRYANNYLHNRAVFLLNQEQFWENGFAILRENDALFSPIATCNFSRYESLDSVKNFLREKNQSIQCVVSNPELKPGVLCFGESQRPSLETYADNIDTMEFLGCI